VEKRPVKEAYMREKRPIRETNVNEIKTNHHMEKKNDIINLLAGEKETLKRDLYT